MSKSEDCDSCDASIIIGLKGKEYKELCLARENTASRELGLTLGQDIDLDELPDGVLICCGCPLQNKRDCST